MFWITSLLALLLQGQPTPSGLGPEPVLQLNQAIFTLDYYRQQAEEWAAVIAGPNAAPDAWLNYYTAARNANVLAQETLFPLKAIVEQAEDRIPETFELNYLLYWDSPLAEKRYDALFNAHELAPERWEIYHNFIHYYEKEGNVERQRHFAELLYYSGHLSQGVLNWNYNALQSVAENGILLTIGDNDTYPAWVLQLVHGFRSDVKVLNVHLLLAEEAYRQRIWEELGISTDLADSPTQTPDQQLSALIQMLIQHSERPVHIGIAAPKELRDRWEDQLYLTGLALRHSLTTFDNIGYLRRNYEERFRLDELRLPLSDQLPQAAVHRMNINYIPSILSLHRWYSEQGAAGQASELESLARQLASRGRREDLVESYFAPDEEPFNTLIDLRAIEKKLEVVGDGLYASATEVTNQEYELFLQDLLRQRRFGLLETCQILPTNWVDLLPEALQSLPSDILFEAGHPEDEEAPIVNISHEAAEAYCDWLTMTYNQSEHRRKQFQEVRFRLPTKEEWVIAAQGGRGKIPYPWGGPYYRNIKGCYLANFNPFLDENGQAVAAPAADGDCSDSSSLDGAFFPVSGESYHPNDFGLFNMAGNAAEMIDRADISMGGGWLDPMYFIQIGVENEQAAPHPNIGFRVFMEVIRE